MSDGVKAHVVHYKSTYYSRSHAHSAAEPIGGKIESADKIKERRRSRRAAAAADIGGGGSPVLGGRPAAAAADVAVVVVVVVVVSIIMRTAALTFYINDGAPCQ